MSHPRKGGKQVSLRHSEQALGTGGVCMRGEGAELGGRGRLSGTGWGLGEAKGAAEGPGWGKHAPGYSPPAGQRCTGRRAGG